MKKKITKKAYEKIRFSLCHLIYVTPFMKKILLNYAVFICFVNDNMDKQHNMWHFYTEQNLKDTE